MLLEALYLMRYPTLRMISKACIVWGNNTNVPIAISLSELLSGGENNVPQYEEIILRHKDYERIFYAT